MGSVGPPPGIPPAMTRDRDSDGCPRLVSSGLAPPEGWAGEAPFQVRLHEQGTSQTVTS